MNRTVFRSRSHRNLCLAVAAGCGLLAVADLAVATSLGSAGAQPAAVVVLAALALLALRYAWASIVVDHSAQVLIVRNPLRTHVLGVDEVEAVELRASRIPNTYRNNRQLLSVRPQHGRPITMIGGCAVGTPAVERMRADLLAELYR